MNGSGDHDIPEMRICGALYTQGAAFLLAAAGSSLLIYGSVSPRLRESGLHLLHAHIGLLGFGMMMALGHQRALLPRALGREPGLPGKRVAAPLWGLSLCVWGILLCFAAAGRTSQPECLRGAMAFAGIAFVCVLFFARALMSGAESAAIFSNMPARLMATSLFMYMLSFMQIIHLAMNMLHPGILPFRETLSMRHSYLALSFPVSLTIIAAMYFPYQKAYDAGRIKSRALWEAQYWVLVAGVFALFFALLFDYPAVHAVMGPLQVAFSVVLLISVGLLAAVLWADRAAVSPRPAHVWRLFTAALLCLALTGAAGFGLGYRHEVKSAFHYFLLQSHIHLALLGWAGLGLTGAFHTVLHIFDREERGLASAQLAAAGAGLAIMLTGIFMQNGALRAAGGAAAALALAFTLKPALSMLLGNTKTISIKNTYQHNGGLNR